MLKYVQFTVIGAALALGACKDDEGKGSGTNATNPSTNPTNDGTESDTSTGTGDQTSNGTTTNPGTTAPEPTTGVATEATDSGVGTESSGSFITPPDGGGGVKECDVWTQDCPPGQKCMPWADNGSSSWNATKCSPVDANPGKEGDPCTVEGSAVSGVDSCDEEKVRPEITRLAESVAHTVPGTLGSETLRMSPVATVTLAAGVATAWVAVA